jgi:Mannosyl-glycoprotein endo-beta-N-acetylglucosaminidase
MKCRVVLGAALACVVPSLPALAADLPAIKSSPQNPVPACVTPGRLMSFIRSRNSEIEPRHEKIAVDYMRHGEALGLRWDYAFFQMAVETGYLTYRRNASRAGDVKPTQNNFAGIGATGKGEAGESFADVPSGVLAHLQHVAVYAGDRVDTPVAERTRRIIEWNIADQIRRKAKGPVTFTDLARKWANTVDYADAIETHAKRFYADFCNKADPSPELVAEARGNPMKGREVAEAKTAGADLARRVIDSVRTGGEATRSGLGAANLARSAEPSEPAKAEPAPKVATPSFSVLGAPRNEPSARADKSADKQPPVKTAAAAAAGQLKPVAPAAPSAKCRVFTASYGGQRAVLIRAQADGGLNYTVLDVNEGTEKREADAYIAAYARGGAIAGEFTSQTQALDKAFELCPEG